MFNARKQNNLFRGLLIIYFLFSVGFGVYYAFEQSRKATDIPFLDVMCSKEYLMTETEQLRPTDAAMYNMMAMSLVETGSFKNINGEFTAIAPPGLPIFLALVYSIFGYKLWAVVLFNSILATLSLLLVFRISVLLFSEKIAWIAFFLQLVNIRYLYHTGSVNYYPLLIFLMLFSFYITVRLEYDNKTSFLKWLLLGIILGIMMLVRPIMAPFAGTLLLYLLVKNAPNKKLIIIPFLVASIFVVSWIGRNYYRLEIITIATYAGKTFGRHNNDAFKNISFFNMYHVPERSVDTNFYTSSENDKQLKEFNVLENELTYEALWAIGSTQDNKRWLKNNIYTYIKITSWRIKGSLSPFAIHMSFRNKLCSTLFWILIIIPGLVGIFTISDKYLKLLFLISSFSTMFLTWFIALDNYLHFQIPFQIILLFPAAHLYDQITKRIFLK